jgi:mannose-6-phosphate isomerase-like protein (cupin superfamily)
MPIRHLDDVGREDFSEGACYQILVGDDEGSTPVRVGIQTSQPGYSTGIHSHPYMEVVTVLEGEGVAWIDGEGEDVSIGPGTTMIFPAGVKHRFTAIGNTPLKTLGVHASPDRIVDR